MFQKSLISLRRLLAIAALALPALAAPAMGEPSVLDDPTFTAPLEAALEQLYDLELAEAERLFGELAARYPEHPATPLLTALPGWWEIQLETSDTSRDAAFLGSLEKVVERAEARLKSDPEDPDARFFKAVALALRGRLQSLRGEWIRAAHAGKKALGLVRDVARTDPGNPDLAFGLGLYDYLADVAPKRYPLFKPLVPFFPKGDRDRGLTALAQVMEEGRFARSEAAWALAQIHYYLEEDFHDNLHYVSWLRRQHPENALYHSFEGRVRFRLGEHEPARHTFSEVLARHADGATGYNDGRAAEALYYSGRSGMAQRRWELALLSLERLEGLTPELEKRSPYRALGHLRRGMSLDALGRRGEAVRQYLAALAQPDAAGAHKRARQYLREPFQG